MLTRGVRCLCQALFLCACNFRTKHHEEESIAPQASICKTKKRRQEIKEYMLVGPGGGTMIKSKTGESVSDRQSCVKKDCSWHVELKDGKHNTLCCIEVTLQKVF